jgi:protease I
MPLKGKKVAMIIAHKGFRDEECLEPKKILEGYGVKVTIVSSSLKPSKGILGTVITPEILVDQTKVANFDGVLFIGGPGSSEYFDNPKAHLIAKEVINVGKVLGAICIAPTTLANAGVLQGKKVTSFPTEEENIKKKGAIWTGAPVEIDGKIITAQGPGAAKAFGEAVAEALKH